MTGISTFAVVPLFSFFVVSLIRTSARCDFLCDSGSGTDRRGGRCTLRSRLEAGQTRRQLVLDVLDLVLGDLLRPGLPQLRQALQLRLRQVEPVDGLGEAEIRVDARDHD